MKSKNEFGFMNFADFDYAFISQALIAKFLDCTSSGQHIEVHHSLHGRVDLVAGRQPFPVSISPFERQEGQHP